MYEEISRFNLWRLISCSVRRQQVAVGTADPLSRLRRQLPFRESPGGVPMPPLKGKATAKRAVGFIYEKISRSD